MNQLRDRLVAVFLAATLVPLGVTLWITTSLLERSLSYASTEELDQLSRALEETARELYRRARETLKNDAIAGRLTPQRHSQRNTAYWPAQVVEFWDSGEPERFVLSGSGGDQLNYLVRHDGEVWLYFVGLGNIRMEQLSRQYRQARNNVASFKARDLRRGFTATLMLLVAAVWLVSLASLVYLAHRISRPIQQLTAGLSDLAAGNLQTRLETSRNDEIGRAIQAFNHMAGQLQQSRERLVYLTQIASWQTLGRKMAHELKNSLTPIRLTVEEMLARQTRNDRAFMEQAAQIVIDEVETLERRVRVFSEFSTEPPGHPSVLDVNAIVEERIAFLKIAHVEVTYNLRLSERRPRALADEDHVKGILTNLLENAAEAAGDGGIVLAVTTIDNGKVAVEVHDSGPGLSEEARQSLFEPTISFKKRGMGLGLSIARRNALLSGGDISLIQGELGGAGFRLVLPQS